MGVYRLAGINNSVARMYMREDTQRVQHDEVEEIRCDQGLIIHFFI